MARPRKYPGHNHSYPVPSAEDGDTYTPTALFDPIFTKPATDRWRRQRGLAHPQKNGYNDPVSIALLVDGLMRLDHTTTIRAGDLADILNRWYPQVLWDPYTVGKILSTITDIAFDTGAPANALPIQRDINKHTVYYIIAPNAPNWKWFGQLRHELGRIAEEMIERERRLGELDKRSEFPWEAFEAAKWGAAAA